MKFMEISGGFTLSVFNDEEEIIRILEKDGVIWFDKMSEFDRELAGKMMSKGLLRKVKEGKRIGFRPNLGDEHE